MLCFRIKIVNVFFIRSTFPTCHLKYLLDRQTLIASYSRYNVIISDFFNVATDTDVG